MADYQELYYACQRKITNIIQVLEQELEQLKKLQQLCEEKVLESNIAIKRSEKSSKK